MKIYFRSVLFIASMALSAAVAYPQTAQSSSEMAKASQPSVTTKAASASQPVYKDYKGIYIGMSADDVRSKLDHLKEKGPVQDYFVFSDQESAQVFYDKKANVTAISVDYIGAGSNAPSPKDVLGEELQAKADGSMYQLKQYPAEGYWVAYNKTAGNDPIVTVTIQKLN